MDVSVISTAQDESLELEQYRNELIDLKKRYRSLAETTSDGIIQITDELEILYANTVIKSLFGIAPAEIVGSPVKKLFPASEYRRIAPQVADYFNLDLDARKARGLGNHLEVLGRNSSGEIVPLEISFGIAVDTMGKKSLPCIIRDITERKKTERKLRYLAYHDKLTALGNRDLFQDSLKAYLDEMRRYGNRKGALLFLDLDGFKKVNDTLGHHVGDDILVECSHRLHSCLRNSDHVFRVEQNGEESGEDVFRFGGDEFVVLLPYLADPSDAAVVARKIIQDVRKPYPIQYNPKMPSISLGVSVGIAVIPDDGWEISTLISNADIAMYRAKERGNTFRYFTTEMNRQVTRRLHLEEGLRAALFTTQIKVAFQPVYRTGRGIFGMEALIRWKHPRDGNISPENFISLAEETGLIIPLGAEIMRKSCRMLGHLQKYDYEAYISVNVSPRQFEDPKFEEMVSVMLSRYNVDPRGLKIEITEGAFLKEPEETRRKIIRLKQNHPGLSFMVDDFGTGYSSFSHLSTLPIDYIKIDKSFVSALHEKKNRKIVRSIIRLVKSLNLEVVAEGVQTEGHVNFLESHGCFLHQGYYYSKALAVKDLLRRLKDERRGRI